MKLYVAAWATVLARGRGAEYRDVNKYNLKGNLVHSCLIVFISGRFCMHLQRELNNKGSRHKVFKIC